LKQFINYLYIKERNTNRNYSRSTLFAINTH